MALTKVTAAVLEPTAVTDNISNGSIDSAKIADDAIVTAKIADDAVATAKIADDSISYAKLGSEFTTTATLSASDVDFSTAQVFTKTLVANDTLTFSNVSTGMVKDLVITGNFTLTLPASVKVISGTYDGTVSNLIQIAATNGSTEQWATISQEAV
jgi:hypothetical protein